MSRQPSDQLDNTSTGDRNTINRLIPKHAQVFLRMSVHEQRTLEHEPRR